MPTPKIRTLAADNRRRIALVKGAFEYAEKQGLLSHRWDIVARGETLNTLTKNAMSIRHIDISDLVADAKLELLHMVEILRSQ